MKPRIRLSLVYLLCLVNVGCQRTVHVTEQMTWECAPDEYKAAYYAPSILESVGNKARRAGRRKPGKMPPAS